MTIRDKLLMELDEAVQFIYENTDKDYESVPVELQRVIDALEHAASVVRTEL